MDKFRLNYICFFAAAVFSQWSMSYASTTSSKIILIHDVKHDVSRPLREVRATLNINRHLPLQVIPLRYSPIKTPGFVPDGMLQKLQPISSSIPLTSFQGMGIGLGNFIITGAPPDANGSVGMNQYVQWVNTEIGVFDKATGTIAPGFPIPDTAIFKGFGGLCESSPFTGDGIVKYDQMAHRWLATFFAFNDSANPTAPFMQCMAVSTSEDATGSWYRYAFVFDSLNDYTKLALGPGGYYMTMNMYGPVSNGPRLCALDRNSMLSGLPVTMQCSQFSWNQTNTTLPADLDGAFVPPCGYPEYFMSYQMPNQLLLFKMNADFNNPANTTLTGPINLTVANFTNACNNNTDYACAVQPGTTNVLETLGDRLMNRVAFRVFADHASMLITHSVMGAAPQYSPAIRWYELRFSTGSTTPVVYQQGTFAPDSNNRFMGSIAMDRMGNIAIGYTVTSSTIYPSIAFASRLASDPLNTLTSSQTILTGQGSQIDNLQRWGDYSGMSIDPVDDCRFWYTNEYLMTTGSFNWSTNISSFKLPGC